MRKVRLFLLKRTYEESFLSSTNGLRADLLKNGSYQVQAVRASGTGTTSGVSPPRGSPLAAAAVDIKHVGRDPICASGQ
jgi:hypothetical protein